MKLIPNTLFGRLVLVLLGGLLLSQLVGAAILLYDRDHAMFETSGRHLAARIASIVHMLDTLPREQRPTFLRAVNTPSLRVGPSRTPTQAQSDSWAAKRLRAALIRRLGQRRPVWVQVREPKGDPPRQTPAQQPSANWAPPNFPPGWAPFDPRFRQHFVAPDGGQWQQFDNRYSWGMNTTGMHLVVRTRLADGSWVRFVHQPPSGNEGLQLKVILTLGVLVITVLALSLYAVQRVTRPLSMLAGAAEDLGRDIHRPPLQESGPQEVRRAAHAFNTMQQRISRYIKDREQMLAAISHDLKTPITRLRLRAEMADDPVFRDKVIQDLDDMETMVSATLDFMRGADNREPVAPIDVMALMESIQSDQQELGATVSLSGEAAPYPARATALKRCLTNLVENAVRYGDEAIVHMADGDDMLTITIADKGPGIPEDRLEAVFEPFVRLEDSRNRNTGGTGLGLSIARTIARAHGGELTLRNRPEGGLIARLTLPR